MANVFNSVKGLHPKRNAFSAHTYRNDFTGKLGLDIPCYIQHLVPGSKIKVSTSALVRLQALLAPVMDNIDFYVHFWKIPYRLLEGDAFTQFISGEMEDISSYGATMFYTPKEFMEDFFNLVITQPGYVGKKSDTKGVLDKLISNGELLDYLGYDASLFHYSSIDDPVSPSIKYTISGANDTTKLNFRDLVAYYMVHLHWYMNENVPYFTNFASYFNSAVKYQLYYNLHRLLFGCYYSFGTFLLPHGWEKDYFTSALPNVQYGDPVSLSLQGNAPVTIPEHAVIIKPTGGSGAGTNVIFQVSGIDGNVAANLMPADTSEQAAWLTDEENRKVSAIIGKLNWNTATGSLELQADLSEASAITINEFRFANALQVFKEREERFGRRRQEYYKGFFDVEPEDLRLQLPKYLGGGRIPINISDIEQTSATTSDGALGHLGGKATAVAGGFAGFSTFASEESVIIGICFAMPHITYANALSKFKLKTNDKYDYFNPSFQHLGEQEINEVEIYPGTSYPTRTFGYTPRFNEYRFHMNEMHGQFKSTLAFWTLGRIFSQTPMLNTSFIYMQPSVFDRIFAVSGQDPLLASMLFRTRLIQPVSKYGTPMLIA